MDMGHTSAMRLAVILGLFLNVTLICSQSFATQRVLIKFDESGFRVHQVISVEDRRAMMSRVKPEATRDIASLSAAMRSLKSGQATLVWQDQNLEWIETTVVPDPRITHSPSHVVGGFASRADLLSGAWIADGPDRAWRVVVLLPAVAEIGLAFEQWPLWLYD